MGEFEEEIMKGAGGKSSDHIFDEKAEENECEKGGKK